MLGLATLVSFKLTNAMFTFMPGALASAAGGRGRGGGFSDLTNYLDRISGYMIPVGGAMAVLGLIYGGCLLMAGAPHAGRTLVYVVVGVVIVLGSRGLAA